MPYRRLPNTDQARIRALKAVIRKVEMCNVNELAVSLNVYSEAKRFLAKFEVAQNYYKRCYDDQIQASLKHQSNIRMARLYISHFIQVLNLSVVRSEIKVSFKKLYNLPIDSNNVPDLTSETVMVEWGNQIVDGEKKRVLQGGIPIYNPTIAKVKVHYDTFVDSYERQKALQSLTNRSLEKISSMRCRADELILDVWNQVETKFQSMSPNETRLNKCREYGLIYYYRKGELHPK